MTPLELLSKEHRAIRVVLRAVVKLAARTEQSGPVDPSVWRAFVGFIRQWADGAHHAKEERVLFEALLSAGMSRDRGPVACMLGEHDLLRDLLRRVEDAAAAFSKGTGRWRDIIGPAVSFCDLLEDHIDKEDFALYPLSQKLLGDAGIMALEAPFRDVDATTLEEFERAAARVADRLASAEPLLQASAS